MLKFAQFFQTFIRSWSLSEKLTRNLPRLSAIVSQGDSAQEATAFQETAFSKAGQAQAPILHNVLPLATRVGFAGIVVIILWWSWPAQSHFTGFADRVVTTPTPLNLNTTTLNILNPANLVGVQQATAPVTDTALPSIVTLPNSATNNSVAAQPDSAQTANLSPTLAAPNTNELAANGQQPVLESEAPPVAGAGTQADMVLVPTAAPTLAATDEPPIAAADLPQIKILPAFGLDDAPPTPMPATPTPGLLPTSVALQLPLQPGRLWSTFTPPSSGNDHFWVARPFIPSVPNQLASPSYQFGSTAGDHYRIHHGADIANVMGTPVLAAVDGEVVHAGPDDKTLLGPYNNFYGNSVVIRLDRRLGVAGGKLDVYLLYGHLSQVNVALGQRVHPADVIGQVGMTGIAIGPHLHVEMRLGANTYQHSINPYLWLEPLDGTGAVAVRLLTADGRTLPGVGLTLARFDNGIATWARLIETYHDAENIGPDPAWGENGAMDGVPAGSYILVGAVNGESIRTNLTVRAGETSFVEIRTKQ